MNKKNNWLIEIVFLFKQFIAESAKESEYEILDIYECQKTGFTKVQIRLSGRHIIEKNISDIVTDMHFLEGFNKKAIRTLTYIATTEKMKPDYSIAVQQLGTEVDEYILEIRSRNGKEITKKSPSEMSKDKFMLSKFSPLDANRIGYLAGVKETVKEFNLKVLNAKNE